MTKNDPKRPDDESTIGPGSSEQPARQPLPSTDGLDQTAPIQKNKTAASQSPPKISESDHAKLRKLFIAACDLSKAEQANFIDQNCLDHPQLKTELIRLLSSDGNSDGVMADGKTRAGIELQFSTDVGGKYIGPYRIIREIGEGGMGSVYEAEQLEPVKRRVALKVIKAGRNSKEVIARFDAERQALAMMDHPTIARIIDAGETDLGQPFFAMELVDGVPLTKYCDERSLAINERLSLFTQICDGIQHAHQKGIVHRDLKPGNILVTEYDGKPVPKIIDFGLAKALETTPQLTDRTLQTEFGQVLGTVRYMSPEQASLDGIDIDTRSDIYTLGIILYELLTGSTPLETDSIQKFAMLQVLELVREKETPRPSSRLSTDKNRLSQITSQRKIEPKRLSQILTGELDWIVMRSLEKERDRRYSSASEFADDIHRFLNDVPVAAKPPSTVYRLRKFVRKNRGLVAAATAIAGLLIAGIASTTYFLIQSNKNAATATANAELERIAKENAIDQKKIAETTAKRTSDVLEIVSGAFTSTNPDSGSDASMTARDVLHNARRAMDNSDLDEPGRTILLEILAWSFQGVGEADAAVVNAKEVLEIRERVLGPDDPKTVKAIARLANCYEKDGRVNLALTLHEQVLEIRKRTLGEDHPLTYVAKASVAGVYQSTGRLDESISILQEVLEFQTTTETEIKNAASTRNNLAVSYLKSKRFKEAIPLLEQALAWKKEHLGPSKQSTLATMSNMAGAYSDVGRNDEALAIYEEALEIQERKLGLDHLTTQNTIGSIAQVHLKARRFDQAVPRCEQLYQLRKAKLDPDHPLLLNAALMLADAYFHAGRPNESVPLRELHHNSQIRIHGADNDSTLESALLLAHAYKQVGRADQAITLYEKTLKRKEEKSGSNEPLFRVHLGNLAILYASNGRVNEGIPILERLVDQQNKSSGGNQTENLGWISNLAVMYQMVGRNDESLETLEHVLELQKKELGTLHPSTLLSMANLASMYRTTGRIDDALPLQKKAYEGMKKTLGPKHPQTLRLLHVLATTVSVRDPAEAALLYREAWQLQKEVVGETHPLTLASQTELGLILNSLEQFAEAEQLLRNLYEIRQEETLNKWKEFNTASLFGEALLGQGKHEEAKTILKAGYQGLVEELDGIPAESREQALRAAIERLIKLAEATENAADLEKWQDELKKLSQ